MVENLITKKIKKKNTKFRIVITTIKLKKKKGKNVLGIMKLNSPE